MATKSLAHGIGTFYKDCEHPQTRWSKCPHEYTIRYRSAAGKQTEEAGFSTQEKAIDRLTTVYQEKKAAPRNQSKAERIQKYGAMQFREYTAEWKAGQRDLAESSLRTLESLLENHILPTLGSRRMTTFDHKVVDGFIRTMERNGAGLATQSNAFDKVKSVLLDAYRLGIYTENPVLGVKPPQYYAERAVIPSPAQVRDIRTAGDDRFLLIADLMSGCGITEQVNQTTKTYGRLKHRKPTDYRDVPLPARVRETIEWYADKHGTVDGYLLRHPMDPTRPFLAYYLQNQWQRIKRADEVDVPDGMVIYSLRHFFASNCLTNGIPITDVAEWMGHKSLDVGLGAVRPIM
ncbi:tyrosine-type recombinase/integrase [Streptomyces sp. 4.24]|uniref:tyrosine-type recombinase/integrase n=1 Tax=Streptomyces tritrimontium TaxID=3406573 RepID=UPI003BB569DF